MSGVQGVRRVVIIGQMGVGKTTVGGGIADQLKWAFLDSDRQIETGTGLTAREVAAKEGVEALHRLELEVLLEALSEADDVVVAAAASVVDTAEGRDALRDPVCIWIDREPSPGSSEEAHRRPTSSSEHLEKRRKAFEQIADYTLSGEGDSGAYVDSALDLLAGSSAGRVCSVTTGVSQPEGSGTSQQGASPAS